MYEERFADAIRQITTDCPFQDKHLDVELAMTLDYASRTCACGRDRSGLDPAFSSAFRYLEKHGAFHKIHGAHSVAETDNRFRAKTRDRLVCKSQFAASSRAGADSITVANAFADRGPALRRLRRTKLHVFHHLSYARFLQLRGT